MKKRIISALRNKKGESSYIDVVILVFVSIMAIVLALNVFSYLTLRQDIDYIASSMADAAAMEGLTESRELDSLFKKLCDNAGVEAEYEITSDEYYNRSKNEVQLGDPLTVTVSCETTFKGLGQLGASMEINVSVSKTSLSRVYFKD